MTTYYELAWGNNMLAHACRYFDQDSLNDAITMFCGQVQTADRIPELHSAWVSLRRSHEAQPYLAWTKTSNERPTRGGDMTPPATLPDAPATAAREEGER